MTTLDINKNKHTISFLSMTIAWATTNILYSAYHAVTDGKVTESGVVIFWTGLFILLAWAIFIVYPLKRLDNSIAIFKPTIFPVLTALYGGLTYTILLGVIFRDLNLIERFIPQSLFVGLVFGFCYSNLIRQSTFKELLSKRPIIKIACYLSPIFLLTFFLWLLPTLFPLTLYRFMPDEIQDKVFAETLVKFKAGDNFQKLKAALPSEFNSSGNTFGSNYTGPLLDYSMEVRNDTIVKLDIIIKK